MNEEGIQMRAGSREKNNMAGGSWPPGFLPSEKPERQHLIVEKPALLASYLFPLWLKPTITGNPSIPSHSAGGGSDAVSAAEKQKGSQILPASEASLVQTQP